MHRLLFLPFLMILFFSCESDSKEIDPLFYQISEADSLRCMEEILEGILFEARESQQLQEELIESCCFVPVCFSPRDIFRVSINNRGDIMVRDEIDSTQVTEKVFEYFMFNRILTSEEVLKASVDPKSPSFLFPFYNEYERKEIERKVRETQNELNDISKVEGVDSLLVDYYASKVNEWKVKLKSLELIGAESLDIVASYAKVHVEYRKASDKSKKVLRDVALAFYQMRNYECLRYFNETYLNLYDRAKRRNRKLDLEKLDVLRLLHRANFYDNYREYSEPIQAPMPPQENF